MKYRLPLLAVRDMPRALRFYRTLFDQEITLDLGENVTLSGGFALQSGFAELLGLDPDATVWQPQNMELYFEVPDMDAFLRKLADYGAVRFVHPVKTYPWHQRVVRIFDPDGHIIEIGESMAVIAKRFLDRGMSVAQTAREIHHPEKFVQAVADGAIMP